MDEPSVHSHKHVKLNLRFHLKAVEEVGQIFQFFVPSTLLFNYSLILILNVRYNKYKLMATHLTLSLLHKHKT
jgi:hypothetical protein